MKYGLFLCLIVCFVLCPFNFLALLMPKGGEEEEEDIA